MDKFTKIVKEWWKVILASVIFAFVAGWWCLFSPWARYEVTDEQLHEMAIEYDAENGTNFASAWEN